VHNLRLLQAADMYSGQFRSLDLIAVDLEFELQSVQSPDKFTFDKPPVKAARRYQQYYMRRLILYVFFHRDFWHITDQARLICNFKCIIQLCPDKEDGQCCAYIKFKINNLTSDTITFWKDFGYVRQDLSNI